MLARVWIPSLQVSSQQSSTLPTPIFDRQRGSEIPIFASSNKGAGISILATDSIDDKAARQNRFAALSEELLRGFNGSGPKQSLISLSSWQRSNWSVWKSHGCSVEKDQSHFLNSFLVILWLRENVNNELPSSWGSYAIFLSITYSWATERNKSAPRMWP